MRTVYADLHIHIGRSLGKPIKITASRNLDIKSIIYNDAPRKGLDMVGIVDAGSPVVLKEIQEMIQEGELREHPYGGLVAKNGIVLILGCEVETSEGVHLISYLPTIDSIVEWQKFMRSRIKNLNLSTQKARANIIDIINLTFLCDGIICPAHAFTPHKGIYGCLTDNITKILGKNSDQIKVLELGLSADTNMADMIAETRKYTFLSNSDAHSPANVGREYNLLRIADKNFRELKMCLENKEGRKVIANYGMDPLMGKYNRSYCNDCNTIAANDPPVIVCNQCESSNITMGVYDRIIQIRDYIDPRHSIGRPPYYYRVPLKYLPGVGEKMYNKLLAYFFSEIEVLEHAIVDEISKVAGNEIAQNINNMRINRLDIIPGGGGKYGKVKKTSS